MVAIFDEEFGFAGCLIIISIYILIISLGIKIALNAADRMGTYLAAGITSVIAIQLLINIAVVTGSIPPTGIPMPFISAGGTSLSVFMGAIGVLCNVGKCKENKNEFENVKVSFLKFKNKKIWIVYKFVYIFLFLRYN